MIYTCMMTQISKRRPASPRQAAGHHSPIDRALDVNIFRALGDPTRARLLACLAKCSRACTVTEVAECCSVDFSVVSRHLAILARAGVLESRKDGRSVGYRVRYKPLSASLRALARAVEECGACDTATCGKDGCCAAA